MARTSGSRSAAEPPGATGAGALETYRSRRRATRTPEPMGQGGAPPHDGARPRFVIQEHHARNRHWDFRLEHEGVLASWALPKGLPVDPATNHLAVRTEDHPLEYASFEGTIPEGEYGGGDVRIWDRGTFELERWSEREVKVVLHGARTEGRYVLFPTRGQSWMVHRMGAPPPGYEPMPSQVRPMLAVAGGLPSDETHFAFELKWDGVRAIAMVEGGKVRAFSRNGKGLAPSFPELRELGELLGSRSAVLDGELVAFDEAGRPSFERLQQRLGLDAGPAVARRARQVGAGYLVFDLLYLDGRSLVHLAYDERRALLEGLHLAGAFVTTPPSFTDRTGEEMLGAAREIGLEGVMAKRRSSPYRPGQRHGDWVKVKRFRTQEVVIGGFTPGRGVLSDTFGALLVGLPGREGLVYVGKVGTGFDEASRGRLLSLLGPLGVETSPFSSGLRSAERAAARFVRPELVGEVQYGEWTKEGRLRHPSWRGLRPDKGPDEVVREP